MGAFNSTPLARRVVAELNRMIALRQKAIKELAPVGPLPLGDDRYDNAANAWTRELRASITSARDLQYVLGQARQGGPSYGGVPLFGSSVSVASARDAMAADDAQLKATENGTVEPLL